MNILCLDPIDSNAAELLRRRHSLVSTDHTRVGNPYDLLADQEIIIFRSGVKMSSELISAAPRLRLLVRAGSGIDNVDIDFVRERGIRLVRIPGPSAQSVAELTFALMLTLSRKVALADRFLRQGHWPKPKLGGPLLAGKTLGIVGVGNIGTRVGELGVAWRMDVIGCVDPLSHVSAEQFASKDIRLASLEDVLAVADFVTLHVPLNDSTLHLIDAPALSRMKTGAFLINTARGGVVDEVALYEELTTGRRLAGAALDVHEHEGEGVLSPFRELPNVVLTPHIGGSATDSQREIGRRLIQIIDSFIEGRIEQEAKDSELVT
jgi:D-3-phosphoglycerate dehydrogenase / 2-oxoglutarate reductase